MPLLFIQVLNPQCKQTAFDHAEKEPSYYIKMGEPHCCEGNNSKSPEALDTSSLKVQDDLPGSWMMRKLQLRDHP